MLTVPDHRILFLNEGDEIIKQILFECGKGLHFVRRHNVSARTIILHGPAIWHNHDHRFNLPVCIKVVEDYLWLTSVEPFLFITSDTVKQVENRVPVPPGVGGRSIDQSLSGSADCL